MADEIKRKVLKVERYHIYGTRGNHELFAFYYGVAAFDRRNSYAQDSQQGWDDLMKLARNAKFTHVKLIGTWSWLPEGVTRLGTYPIPKETENENE